MGSRFKKIIKKLFIKNADKFIPLNDAFSYGISKNTAHIHMPQKIDKIISENGIHYAMEYTCEKLYDALQKLVEISEKDKRIKQVFAVSPLLRQKAFRERIEVLGFRTEQADPKFENFFPGVKNLYQGSIPISRLKEVLAIEKEAREGMDQNGSIWHDRILCYKYAQLKKIGIIDYYDIPLDRVIDLENMNYRYRHGLPIVGKKEIETQPSETRGERHCGDKKIYDNEVEF